MNCKDLVITVPGFFTEQERNSLLDACKIAEIKCLKIMNETSATALEYGILRRKELD
jgi:molecular chaperone DnaK (HSP70)